MRILADMPMGIFAALAVQLRKEIHMVNYYSLKVMEKRRFRSRNVSIVVAGAQTEKTLDVAEVEVGGPGKCLWRRNWFVSCVVTRDSEIYLEGPGLQPHGLAIQ
ncbi:unnamed protein product [Cuscuta campestris]|uniref:Uncharacterized protein n=1 Tax=Cuscuta campestris TaxID=132261 RepID=A0A484KT47_9ASTE|nr:unnamed protein product [Cuscuta campestris]